MEFLIEWLALLFVKCWLKIGIEINFEVLFAIEIKLHDLICPIQTKKIVICCFIYTWNQSSKNNQKNGYFCNEKCLFSIKNGVFVPKMTISSINWKNKHFFISKITDFLVIFRTLIQAKNHTNVTSAISKPIIRAI